MPFPFRAFTQTKIISQTKPQEARHFPHPVVRQFAEPNMNVSNLINESQKDQQNLKHQTNVKWILHVDFIL